MPISPLSHIAWYFVCRRHAAHLLGCCNSCPINMFYEFDVCFIKLRVLYDCKHSAKGVSK
jgi:hypothetical protein